MCIEDLRLGRKKITALRQVSVGAVVVPNIIPFSENRTHITVHTNGNAVLLATSDADFTSNGTLNVVATAPPIDLDVEVHGDIVTKSWSAIAPLGGTALLIIETFLEDK